MEVVNYFETFVVIYQTLCRDVPEESMYNLVFSLDKLYPHALYQSFRRYLLIATVASD
jgi:hypothetical protein